MCVCEPYPIVQVKDFMSPSFLFLRVHRTRAREERIMNHKRFKTLLSTPPVVQYRRSILREETSIVAEC